MSSCQLLGKICAFSTDQPLRRSKTDHSDMTIAVAMEIKEQNNNRFARWGNEMIPYSTFLAPCALNFSEWGQIFEVIFFLLSAHFNRLLYIEGNEFKD